MSPNGGSLGPQQNCKLSATFRPKAAKVYNISACCRFGGNDETGDTKTMVLEGIGKYPHVTVRLAAKAKKSPDPRGGGRGAGSDYSSKEVLVDFGQVAVGSVAESWIQIVNVSPVSGALVT